MGRAPNNGKDPFVIELRRTRGMSKRTFDRKAKALEELGQEGKLVRHKVPRKKGPNDGKRMVRSTARARCKIRTISMNCSSAEKMSPRTCVGKTPILREKSAWT